MSSTKTLEDYGALGGTLSTPISSLPDDTANIQNALDNERELRIIPDRRYRITSPLISRMVPKIEGGGHSSIIYADFSGSQDAALIFRNPGIDPLTLDTGAELQDFAIDSPCPCILFDLTGGAQGTDYFNRWSVHGLSLKNRNTSGVTHAVELKNPTVSDGFFSSVFEGNFMEGGFKMQRLGDSVIFRDNTIYGEGVGIYLDAVQGATGVVIEENNISSLGAAIFAADYVQNIKIENNNLENLSGNPAQMLILWPASGKNIIAPIVRGNSFNANNQLQAGGSIIAVGLCTGGLIDENSFTNAATGIWFSGNPNKPTEFRYGKRNRYSGVATPYINNAGTGLVIE